MNRNTSDCLRKLFGKFSSVKHFKGEHGVVVRAFRLYWDAIRFEALSTHHCWALSKSFIPSLVVWSVTQNDVFGGEKQNKKSNREQSDLCDLEQVTLKPQLQVHHCLTIWLQIWYHSLLWVDSIRMGGNLEKQSCLFGVHPADLGNKTFFDQIFIVDNIEVSNMFCNNIRFSLERLSKSLSNKFSILSQL